ncbi:MAG: carboxypeptidase regulatory-like domain-containing protein [Candidatus Sumerlaeaceae bacterium]
MQDEEAAPIDDALVRLNIFTSPQKYVSTTGRTNHLGQFRFEGLAPLTGAGARADLYAVADGFAESMMKEYSVELPRLQESTLTLTLYRPVELRGRVVGRHDQAPVQNAQVALLHPDYLPEEGIDSTTEGVLAIRPTDSQGNFQFSNLHPGYVTVVISHLAFAMQYIPQVNAASTTLAIALEDGGTVNGTVLDRSGPARNARIKVSSKGRSPRIQRITSTDSSGYFEVAHLPLSHASSEDGFYTAEAEASNSRSARYDFQLTPSQPGREFLITPDTDRTASADQLKIAAVATSVPPTETPHSVRLGLTGSISGAIRIRSPKNLEQMWVTASGFAGTGRSPVGPDGRFQLQGLVPGEYRLAAAADNMLLRDLDPILPSALVKVLANTTHPVEMAEAAGALQGRLDGITSGAEYQLRLFTTATTSPLCPGEDGLLKTIVPQSNGSFTVSGLCAGAYRVVAEVSPHSSIQQPGQKVGLPVEAKEFRSDGHTTANVVLRAAACRVRGRVVEAGSRAPLADAKVQLRTVNNSETSITQVVARTNSDGDFQTEWIPKGSYVVAASASGNYAPATTTLTVDQAEDDLGEIALKQSRSGILIRLQPPLETTGSQSSLRCSVSRVGNSASTADMETMWARAVGKNFFLIQPLTSGLYNLALHSAPGDEPDPKMGRADGLVVGEDMITEVLIAPQTDLR